MASYSNQIIWCFNVIPTHKKRTSRTRNTIVPDNPILLSLRTTENACSAPTDVIYQLNEVVRVMGYYANALTNSTGTSKVSQSGGGGVKILETSTAMHSAYARDTATT